MFLKIQEEEETNRMCIIKLLKDHKTFKGMNDHILEIGTLNIIMLRVHIR